MLDFYVEAMCDLDQYRLHVSDGYWSQVRYIVDRSKISVTDVTPTSLK